MKHYLLNHQPQKGLQAACAQQGQAPTCNARGKGHTSASPKTLTKVILVLLTTLLLPSAAWGEANSVTYTFGSPNLDNNTVVSTTGQAPSATWNIKDLKINKDSYSLIKSESTLGFNVSGSNISQTATISFDLISDFGIIGTVTSIDIKYNTGSNISSGTFSAGKDLENITESLFDKEALETSTSDKTKSFSIPTDNNHHQFFKNDKIRLAVSFNADLSNVSNVYFNIKSITIHTNTISVGGYCPNETGAIIGGNITSYSGKEGDVSSVGYDATNHILTLENAKIQGYLYYSEDADLTIKLIGDNAFFAINNYSGDVLTIIQSTTDTQKLTIQKNGQNASLKLFSAYSGSTAPNWDDINLISGFSNTNTELTVLESTNGSNLPGQNYAGKLVAYTTLSLKVAGNSPTTNGTISGSGIEGSVLFDVSSNELTLDNTTISGPIEWNNGSNDLTIYLKGKNSVIINKGESSPVSVFKSESSCSLKVEKVYQAESATLKYASYGTIDGKTSDVASYFDNFILSTNTAFKQATSVIDGIRYNYLTTADTYNISVAGIQVHGIEGELGYKNNILNDTGESIVMFDGSNTLTLKNATINGPIKSSIGDLHIHLIGGNNTMSGISSDSKPFQYTGTETAGSGTLTFETTDAEAGELTMNGIHESGGIGAAITSNYSLNNEFTNSSTISDNWVYFSYYDSSKPDNQNIVINKNIDYHLSIGGQPVGKSNASSILGTTMSFTPGDDTAETPATLTLTGARITNGGIAWSGSDNLIIALNGVNIISNDNGPAINSSAVDLNPRPKLTFVKAADATACSLTLTSGTNYSFISNFAGETYVEPGSGLFYLVKESSATVTSTLLGGGSGTEADPFLITTADQLKDFSSYVNNGIITTEFVKLANDIDRSSLSDFTPIGNSDHSFAGTFDGNNKTISSLTINSEETDGYVGLFRLIVEGTVKNLTLTGAQISGGSATGVIAGFCSGAIIEGCTVNSSSVSCSETAEAPKVGGIVGDNYGTITDCVVSASAITASTSDTKMSGPAAYAGGIVGYTTGGTIKNNSVTGATTVFTYYNGGGYLYSGAVIGYINNEGSSAATLSGNSYEATVTTETKKTESLTKQGQQQRGIGSSSDEIGKIELAGTKSITIGTLVEDIDEVSDYYLSSISEENESTTILALPEKNVVIALSSEVGNDETVRYTITNASTNGKIEATIDQVTPTDRAPYTKIAFTMPNADVKIDSEILGLGNAETLGLSDSKPSATYYNPNQSMTLEDGIVGYVITGVSGASVTMTRISYIPKGVPVYVKMGTSEETPAEEAPASKLKYATETVTGITTESQLFVLYKDKFVKVTSGTDIPATKCYLDLSGVTAAGTRGFYYIEGGDDGTTAIREVRSGEAGSEKTADGGWHDLQGRKLTTKPAKGLYIRNGKKVVVK